MKLDKLTVESWGGGPGAVVVLRRHYNMYTTPMFSLNVVFVGARSLKTALYMFQEGQRRTVQAEPGIHHFIRGVL